MILLRAYLKFTARQFEIGSTCFENTRFAHLLSITQKLYVEKPTHGYTYAVNLSWIMMANFQLLIAPTNLWMTPHQTGARQQ